MEAKTTVKTSLIFLGAFAVSFGILKLSPKREMQAGGCGPRALHSAALVLGCKMTEPEVLNLFPRQGFEVSIGEMELAAPKLGLLAKSRQMTIEALKREKPVGVLHIDDTHFVAVVGYEGDSIEVVDSLYKGEDKPVRWLIDDLKTRWDSAILVLSRKTNHDGGG